MYFNLQADSRKLADDPKPKSQIPLFSWFRTGSRPAQTRNRRKHAAFFIE